MKHEISTPLLQHECDSTHSSQRNTALVSITARLPNDTLYQALREREAEWLDAGIHSIDCIGDALAPGLIAHAVYAGHRYAQELGVPREGEVPFKRHFHVGQ